MATDDWVSLEWETPRYTGIYEVKTTRGRELVVQYTLTHYGARWDRLEGDDLRDDRANEYYTHWRTVRPREETAAGA